MTQFCGQSPILLQMSENSSCTWSSAKGPYEPELRKQAVELGIESHVRWLGFVSEEELPQVYWASDLFVLCTRDAPEERAVEGFGLVFLEAQACGTPVVGTRTGGIPAAILDGEGGWLIEQDDTQTLTDIIRQLVHLPESFLAWPEYKPGSAFSVKAPGSVTDNYYFLDFAQGRHSQWINTTATMASSSRLPSLDGLRALSICMVVMGHCSGTMTRLSPEGFRIIPGFSGSRPIGGLHLFRDQRFPDYDSAGS